MKTKKPVIESTGQVWKLRLGFAVIVLGGAILIYARNLDGPFAAKVSVVGIIVSLGAAAITCLTVRCPRCSAAWVWMAASERSHPGFLKWLNSLTVCPRCGYPGDPARAQAQVPHEAMTIRPDEKEIQGEWNFDGTTVHVDATCERIHALVADTLREVATDPSGRDTLYQDPGDGRYWELLHPQGRRAGPPVLRAVTPQTAQIKYRLET